MIDVLVKLLEVAAAVVAVVGGLYAFWIWWKRHNNEDISTRDREKAAFQLGRLTYLLLILEEGLQQGQIQREELERERKKTLDFLETVLGANIASTIPSTAPALDILSIAVKETQRQHAGRVENAFSIGGMVQVLQLSGGKTETFAAQLQLLARDKSRIWTQQGTLLPHDKNVRNAARLLYDAATRGVAPERAQLTKSLETLIDWYTNAT